MGLDHIRIIRNLLIICFFFFVDNCSDILGDETILSNEGNQALLYSGKNFESWDACESFIAVWAKQQLSEVVLKATLRKMINFIGSHNVREIWTVHIGNSLDVKHFILLLRNQGYLCSCLSILQCGIVCRHYFQVMLTSKMAFFHYSVLMV